MSSVRLAAAFLIGTLFGWAMAYKAVATDCERLGAFYDGKRVQRCSASGPIKNNT